MDREEALTLLRGGPDGVRDWNTRRATEAEIPSLGGADFIEADLSGANLGEADLGGANLSGAKLSGANLSGVNLSGAKLSWAKLSRADLSGANLSGANLSGANLSGVNLSEANLNEANLFGTHIIEADLSGADLSGADLSRANLSGAKLSRAKLSGADLSKCVCFLTTFGDADLSNVKGLESIRHSGPSTVGVDTIVKSLGKIPEAFLRGCGVPDVWIANIPALIGAMQPIQFYSCFLSHSSVDKDFARRLHTRMREEGLRVWFDEVDMQSGKKLHEQIDEAIRVHDKLLIVLSPNSMNSDWVKTELRKAFKQEKREGKRKLFPLGLAPYAEVREWECFDADHGKDLAVEVREYFIPDFTNWKNHDAFEAGFARLLKDLKAEGLPAAK